MRIWKLVGLAGIVGVAAVGIVAGTTTVQRKRREFVDAEPDELRTRLQARLQQAQARDSQQAG
jgi:hypothetical protein